MNKNIERLAEILGIAPNKLEDAIDQVGEEEQQHFYYNPNIFAGLLKVDGKRLRDLVVPDLSRLRR